MAEQGMGLNVYGADPIIPSASDVVALKLLGESNANFKPLMAESTKWMAMGMKLYEEDPFLQQIISETNRIDLKVDTMKQQHEREIKQQFTDSKRIKEQLATFAVRRGLNTALNELWSEINCLGGGQKSTLKKVIHLR